MLTAVKTLAEDKALEKEYEDEISKNQTEKIAEKFDAYLKFVFRRECEEYRIAYNKKDRNFENNSLQRKAYLNNRNLLFDLFDKRENGHLSSYFERNNITNLNQHLEVFKDGFNTAQLRSFIHITKLNREEIIFRNGFLDYVSGEEKLAITFVFNSSGEKITQYAYNYGAIQIVKE